MYTPPAIVLDFETALLNGEPSVEYYREDFRVISAAFAWRAEDGSLKTLCLEGEDEVATFLRRVVSTGTPVVVHNFQFEYGVCLHRFSGLESCLRVDTMRLTQVADNGGKYAHREVKPTTYDDIIDIVDGMAEETTHSTGLGLVACVSRWLPEEYHNHKEPYHKWLRENVGVKKGHEGANLTSLPADMLEAYNVRDAEVTLLLYERLTKEFQNVQYDPSLDHSLYSSSAKLVATAKGVGIKVNTSDLEQYVKEIQAEVAEIERCFRAYFSTAIVCLEASATDAYVMALKTERGRDRRRKEIEADPSIVRFNVGSGKQLKTLLVDTLGITPKFWTKAPKLKPGKERKKPFVSQPSFKAAHLSTYGEGGELLIKRRKRLLVMKQAQALIKLAAYDGKWHLDIRAAGTATGRMAGGART